MAGTATQTPDRTPDGWGRVADPYDTYIAPFFTEFAADALHRTGLQAGERVLDVAAGTGALTLQAARRGADVLATDFAPDMVARLRRRAADEGLGLRIEVMDGQALDLPDGSFDAAYSNFGLMFFPDRAAGFGEMRRVLRDGGRAGVVVWAAPERSETFSAFLTALHDVAPDLPPPKEPPAVFSLADPAQFASEMRGAGFADVKVEPVQHVWELPSPDTVWPALTTTNPVIPGLMAALGEDKVAHLRDTFVGDLQERFGEGPVRLRAEALLGVGRV